MFILFFCFLVLQPLKTALAGEVSRGLERRWPILTSDEGIWLGTAGGLYRYDVSEDGWQIFTPREGLCHWKPEILGLDQGILWVGASDGFCSADIQLFDWDAFDTTRGLPGNHTLSFAFEEDYVWVGTDGGVVRYDPLVEEVENFTGDRAPPATRINDIAVEDQTVWLATENGIWEYSVEYETWRSHGRDQGLRSQRAHRIVSGAGITWFQTDAGLERFDSGSRTWFFYQIPGLERINDLALDGTTIWLATDGGIFFYDTPLDQWREFQELHSLDFERVNGIAMAQGDIWLTTDRGVARFDTEARTWTLYTTENGLSSNQTKTIASWGQILFVTSEGAIDYYKFDEDRWYSQPVQIPEATGQAARRGPVLSLGGPRGTVFQPSEIVQMRLLGRASYQFERTDTRWLDQDTGEYETRTQGRTDLVLASTWPGNRTANAFYDDTRFEEDREYGARYRGAEDDLVQDASAGDMRWDLSRGELLPALGLFGGGARIETGARTARLKRKRLALGFAGGDQTTDFQTDFFIGSAHSQEGSVEDRQYLARRFFSLAEDPSDLPLRASSARIYRDDGSAASNTANTREGWSVAGLVGDFDLLHPVDDYVLDEVSGVLDLLSPIPGSTLLVAVFDLRGRPGDPQEVVLYGEGHDRALVNRYSLGGGRILPQTLFLSIVDQQGAHQALDGFGLDADGDGAVDGANIDFSGGVLRFPVERPFPDTIYSGVDAGHEYTIEYRYQTTSSTLQLSQRDLISGSEQVVVDGRSLRRGEDYIVDYRNGNLLFLREGLVEQGSRVEVEYEYRRQSEDRLLSAGLSFSPSDVLTAAVSAVQFDPQDGDDASGSVRLVHANAEVRFAEGPAGMDLLLLSEAARSLRDELGGSAATMKVSAKRDDLRLLAELEEYGDDFHSLRPRRTALGQLARRARLQAQYERHNLFVLEGNWSRESSLDEDGSEADEERYETRAILNRRDLPSVVAAFSRRAGSGASPFPDQTALRGDLEYQLPRRWLSPLGMHAAKIISYLHHTWEDGVDSTYSPVSEKAVRQGDYVRLDLIPRPEVQMAASLRRDRRRIQDPNAGDTYQPAEETGEAIFTTNCDYIPGVSLYARLEGDSREDMTSGEGQERVYTLDRQRQVITRIYPGMWQQLFNLLTMEFNYTYRWNGQLSGVTERLGFRERYWSAFSSGDVSSAERFESTEARLEVRPAASLTLNLGVERQEQVFHRLSSATESGMWSYDGRLELRRAGSVYVLSYLRDEVEKEDLYEQTRDGPSAWWERRWNRGLISKLSLFLWREVLHRGAETSTFTSVSPRLGITSRRDRVGFLGAVELVDDLSVTLSESETGTMETSSRVISNALKLDLRPLAMTLLRLQSQVSHTVREGGSDTLRHDLTVKLTVQF
jgi:hypothetical protein